MNNNDFQKDIPTEKILIYVAKERTDDYTEETKILTYMNAIPINAIVTQLSDTQVYWRTNGIMVDIAFGLLVDKKYKALIDQSYRIKVRNTYFCYGMKANSKVRYKEMGNDLEILTWQEN